MKRRYLINLFEGIAHRRVLTTRETSIITPPMDGVPSFSPCVSFRYFEILSPKFFLLMYAINHFPKKMVMSSEVSAAYADLNVIYRKRLNRTKCSFRL